MLFTVHLDKAEKKAGSLKVILTFLKLKIKKLILTILRKLNKRKCQRELK